MEQKIQVQKEEFEQREIKLKACQQKIHDLERTISTQGRRESTRTEIIYAQCLTSPEQRKRNFNLLSVGLHPARATIKDVLPLFNNRLGAGIFESDLMNVCTLGLDKSQRPITRVIFNTMHARQRVYLKRTLLRGDQIYINEDLMPHLAQLHFQARLLCRERRINRSWTLLGQLYVKITEDGPAVRITSVRDLSDIAGEQGDMRTD